MVGRTGALLTAVLLSTAGLASAVEPAVSLEVDPIEAVVVRETSQTSTFTATLLDGTAEIGCLEVVLPDGWTIDDATGTAPASAWSASIDGTTATWSANNNGAIIDTVDGTAELEITATAPDSPGESPWDVTAYEDRSCTGTPVATLVAAVVVSGGGGGGGHGGGGGGGHDDDGDDGDDHEHEGPPEGHPGFAFEGGNGDGDGQHGVIVDVTHTVDDNRGEWRIKCVLVTLPDGYTDIAVEGILPETGWMGSVDGMVVRYGAGEGGQPLRLPSPGMEFPREASFLITATPPEGDGPFEWATAAYSPEACEDTSMATPLGTATYVYADDTDDDGGGGDDGTGDDGGDTTGGTGSEDADADDTPEVLATDADLPEVLATDPPVPSSIPAGEGPAPLTQRAGTASVLAGLAAAAAALAALIRRRAARREREEVTAR